MTGNFLSFTINDERTTMNFFYTQGGTLMGKHSLRQTWESVRRPLGYVCSGMIIMIVAMVGLFWYYTGRPSSMFEFFRTLEN